MADNREHGYLHSKSALEGAARVIKARYELKCGASILDLADYELSEMDEYAYDDHKEEFAEDFGGNPYQDDGGIDEQVFGNYLDFLIETRGISFFENDEQYISTGG